MIITCSRHGYWREYHEGPVTGGTMGKHRTLRNQINDSGVLTLNDGGGKKRGKELCNECMEEFLRWLKNKDANVCIKVRPTTGKK
jgi:hypothetical protein